MPDDDPFESAADHYADHRPAYGSGVVGYLRGRFGVDGTRVLDLGCGTGQLAVPLAAHAAAVVGVDPSEAMLERARARGRTADRENITWRVGTDADVSAGMGPFRLTTMGRSFHRMDGAATLDRVAGVTESGGGVALLGDAEWLTRGTREWQDEVYAVAERYLDDLPERTGPVEYDDPWDELLLDCGWVDVEVVTVERTREWDLKDVVGYVRSLSYCSPARLGDSEAAFERALRARLARRGPFVEDARLTVISGRR